MNYALVRADTGVLHEASRPTTWHATKRDRERIADFVGELQKKGCQALAYRLTGDAPLDHICVRHLGQLRVIVAFADTTTAWVLLIGSHDDKDPGIDIYTELYRLAGFRCPSGRQANQAAVLRQGR